MNNYYFNKEKTIIVLDNIKKEIQENKKYINDAIKLDFKEWEINVDFEKFFDIINVIKNKEYLPKFSKEKIIDGIGKIILISNQNPYLIFDFILSCIYTNNKVVVLLEEKMLATNKVIIEIIKKVIKKLKLDSDTVDYIESLDEFFEKQDNYDLLYYFGNKEEYIKFIKRIHIDSIFENFGEMYVYIDSKEFKEEFFSIDKFAYLNDINVKYFNTNFNDSLLQINKHSKMNKISVIFTQDIEKAFEFIKKIKTENVYININPCKDFNYETDMKKLVYTKIIKKNNKQNETNT